jgi:acyl-CoA thioester hydrolase
MTKDAKDERREDYRHFMQIPTRWIDNDIYAHVNNAVYYTYFDTIINHYLIEEGGLDPRQGDVIGFAVETFCRFLAPISFPDVLDVGLRIGKLGDSSIRYELAIFIEDRVEPCAVGHFVHVFVNRHTQRPQAIRGKLRDAMTRLLVDKEH